ncbi:hypothetical protein OQX61_07460 [Pedobacter sp. PLR]|uniref:hypothetical protein n=1 Tax=Pedobacter sp. PLR TaxID=2994465 RepID=UPI0022451EAF|nr:hypothetical protein [Pedobacter sp. PLR]MCX2451106.1 hypothetical protein [Pedobacter sp. PLR]
MKIDDVKIRINELISLSEEVLSTQKATQGYSRHGASVNALLFNQLRASSLSFLKNLFGENHPYYQEFNTKVKDNAPSHTNIGKGILMAVKHEIDGGWLFTIKGLVSAEIFSDFLEMAEHLLQEGYKDPAAVMTGSVLEEHLRQLCNREGIAVEEEKSGKFSPKKADRLNADLASAGVYNKLDQKSITSWLDLRNKAAHGKYTEYTKEQVDLMYQGVTNFISRTS